MSSLAEFESDLTAERTRAALGYLRRQGRRVSRFPPYGFDLADDGVTLVENAGEHAAIELMRTLRNNGMSYRAVVAEVEKRKIQTKRGGRWTAKVVRAILLRNQETAA